MGLAPQQGVTEENRVRIIGGFCVGAREIDILAAPFPEGNRNDGNGDCLRKRMVRSTPGESNRSQ